MTLKER